MSETHRVAICVSHSQHHTPWKTAEEKFGGFLAQKFFQIDLPKSHFTSFPVKLTNKFPPENAILTIIQ